MTRLPVTPYPIVVTVSTHQRPQRFVWGAHQFVVEQVTDEWQVDADWWTPGGHHSHYYLALTTTAGTLVVIYRDLVTDQWFLEQVYD